MRLARLPQSARMAPLAGLLAALLAGLWQGTAFAQISVAGSTNIAAAANGGMIKAFSSEARKADGSADPLWQVTNLIDGKHVTGSFVPSDSYGWASAHPASDTAPQWIIFAFEGERTRLISRVVIDPATDSPDVIGRWVRDIEIQVSTTTAEGPWRTVRRALVVNRAVQQAFDFAPTEARYVRLVITSNHGSDLRVEAGEVEIYEAIVPDSVLDQVIINLSNLVEDLKRYRDSQLYRQERETLSSVTSSSRPTAAPVAPVASAAPAAAAPSGGATASTVAATAATVVVSGEGFQFLAPADWERVPELEGGEGGAVVVMVGADDHATVAFSVIARRAESLAAAVAAFAGDWEGAQATVRDGASLAGEPATKVSYVQGERVGAALVVVKGGTGYCLRANTTKGTRSAEQAQSDIAALLARIGASFALTGR